MPHGILPAYRIKAGAAEPPERNVITRPFTCELGNDPLTRASDMDDVKQQMVSDAMVDVACEVISSEYDQFDGRDSEPPTRGIVRAALLLALEENRLQQGAAVQTQRTPTDHD